MKTRDFYFELPQELIAQYPVVNRSESRLLVYNRQTHLSSHHQFKDLIQFLKPGDVLVMNNSKVIPARLYATKSTGGRVELLVERLGDNNTFLAHIRASKSPKEGMLLHLENNWCVQVLQKSNDLYYCQTLGDRDMMLDQIGHIPLPPYISRSDEKPDLERYQTVYAAHKGSVAAPTAGLHFDQTLLHQLQEKGILLAYSTLHIGAGTFRPVRTEKINDHKMHSEYFIVDEALCAIVNKARSEGRRVIAVGTTALRCLESAASHGILKPCQRETDIFIYPGYKFQICDGLITNFHLPESTLLMLVAAFIGHAEVMALYQEAIARSYRFFSYGDASLLI